jgi:hypothetical protein
MSKNIPGKEIHEDEIDLLDLFRRIGRTISGWFQALGTAILTSTVFLLRNFIYLFLSLLLGISLSYLLKWTTKPLYRSEISFRSNTIPNSEMISYMNKLKLLIKEKNYTGASEALAMNIEKASKIKEIEAFWVVDKNMYKIPDYVDYRNRYYVYDTLNSRMQDRFVIRVKLTDPSELPGLRNGIISFAKRDPVFLQKNDFRLRKADELLVRLNYDIKQLDSLQKVKYFEETRKVIPEKGGQMIFLQEQKTQLVYEDIYNLYQRKQTLDQEKELYPDLLTVISDFYQPVKRQNGGLYFGVIIIPLSFILMLIYLIMHQNRKKLREIYKKY